MRDLMRIHLSEHLFTTKSFICILLTVWYGSSGQYLPGRTGENRAISHGQSGHWLQIIKNFIAFFLSFFLYMKLQGDQHAIRRIRFDFQMSVEEVDDCDLCRNETCGYRIAIQLIDLKKKMYSKPPITFLFYKLVVQNRFNQFNLNMATLLFWQKLSPFASHAVCETAWMTIDFSVCRRTYGMHPLTSWAVNRYAALTHCVLFALDML